MATAARPLVQELMEQNLHRLQALFDHAQDGFLLADDESKIVDANPAACVLLGYDRTHLLELLLADVFKGHADESGPVWWKRLFTLGQLEEELTLLRNDETSIVVDCRAVVGIVDGIQLLALRDITERKKSEEHLRDNAEVLRVLSRQLLEAQESERRNLARELHDEIGQTLTAISINLQMIPEGSPEAGARRLQDSIRIVDRALAQVRNLSLDLRPSILDDLGLNAALEWLLDRQKTRRGWIANFHSSLPDMPRLPAIFETSFFRVAQEALTNVMRHGRAQHVWIELARGQDAVHLTVRDDGVGFEVDVSRQRAIRGGSMGLLGMQERIDLLGGKISITSEPGKGTTIHASAPLLGGVVVE